MVTAGKNRLVVQCPAELGSATTDQTKLRQAALNLMSNAAKFTKEGTIVLSAARERKASGDWIEIRVSDTGIGLSKEEMSRLFENFSQASAETSKQYGGTGLGLAISQRFCALMGGGIAVTSEVGRGSVFSICVPANRGGSTEFDRLRRRLGHADAGSGVGALRPGNVDFVVVSLAELRAKLCPADLGVRWRGEPNSGPSKPRLLSTVSPKALENASFELRYR